MTDAASGYAVFENNRINVSTIMPERRGAIVNWLIKEAGVFVLDAWPDETIEDLWQALKGDVEVAPVSITMGPPE